jgi:hypothetical protein
MKPSGLCQHTKANQNPKGYLFPDHRSRNLQGCANAPKPTKTQKIIYFPLTVFMKPSGLRQRTKANPNPKGYLFPPHRFHETFRVAPTH